MSDCRKPQVTGNYDPETVIVYGKAVETLGIVVGDQTVNAAVSLTAGGADLKLVAVYGYAYQGHCYSLSKPKILVGTAQRLPDPEADEEFTECCFSTDEGYERYLLKSANEMSCLELSSGTVKEMILDENLPGRRSPQAYAQAMQQSPGR